MPKVSWTELNDLVHEIKSTLSQVDSLELEIKKRCKKLKKDLLGDLSKIDKIVLAQVNGKE